MSTLTQIIKFLNKKEVVFTSGFIYGIVNGFSIESLRAAPLTSFVEWNINGLIYGMGASLVASITPLPCLITPLLLCAVIANRILPPIKMNDNITTVV